MKYQKIHSILESSAPNSLKPVLTDSQIEKLKSSAAVTLVVVGAVGVLSLAALAPNMLMVLDKVIFRKNKYKKRLSREEKINKTTQAFYYLKRHGLIKFKDNDGKTQIFITQHGKKKLLEYNFNTLSVPKTKKWDGRWWQVAADIPTKQYRWQADLLRKKIKEMGFFPLQRTLWFYPYDPRQEIEFICQNYGIGQFVTVMEICRMDMEDERVLKKNFHL